MKTKIIGNNSISALCVGVFLVTIINCALVFGEGGGSSNGNGDLAFSQIKENNPKLTNFEILVIAFKESANKELTLKWKNDLKPDSAWQLAMLLDTNKHLLYNTFAVINNGGSNNTFYEEINKVGKLFLARKRRGLLLKNIPSNPVISISSEINGTPWYGPGYLQFKLDKNSIITAEDWTNSRWEIRQYNENIILFAQLPRHDDGKCIFDGYAGEHNPFNGYCLLGYLEKTP